MKRGPLAIKVVAVACVAEVLFLFYSYVRAINAPGWLWLAVSVFHIAFVAGLGIFFFRWNHGPKISARTRIFRCLAFLLGTPFAAILGGVVFLTLVIFTIRLSARERLQTILVLAAVACLLYIPVRLVLRNRRTFDEESRLDEWIRQRRSEPIADRKRRLLGIRIASAIPATLVLFVHVFFFPFLTFTFLMTGKAKYNVGGYQVTAPAAWVIFEPNFGDGDDRGEFPVIDSVSGCRPISDFPARPRCTSLWSVGQRRVPHTSYQFFGQDISHQDSLVQNPHETFLCTESWGYRHEPDFVEISCESPSLLHASYDGPREHAGQFYDFVRSMRWRDE